MIKRHWVSIASAITVTSIVSLARSALDAMDSVNKMSQKVGVSVEALQGYQYAARLADVESEALSKSLAKLSRNIWDATRGSVEIEAAFNRLGLSVKSSDGQLKTTDQMLEDIAEKFSHMKDGTEKTALAMVLFGRSGRTLFLCSIRVRMD
jgi:TnpA family transposase